jgi:O-antigen/teichoic acid export membrane protein
MPLYSRRRTRRSLIDTLAFRAISQVATILGFVVMVRGMTKQDFGAFNLLYTFIPVISTVASLGLEQTLRRYQPEYLKAGKTVAANWLVRFVSSARFGTNILLLGLILFFWNAVAPFFKMASYRAEFAIFGVLVLFFFQSRILQISLAAHMLHRYSVGAMALLSLAKLGAYGILSWYQILTLRNAILGEIAAFGIAYVFLVAAYRRNCLPAKDAGHYRPDPAERKRLLRYGFFNNFNDAGTLLLTTKSDNLFIAAILDPISVGVYAFYTRLSAMGSRLLPATLFENVVQPVFFAVSKSEADRKIPQYFSLLLNLDLMLQWPILAFAIAYHAELVVAVFGGKFAEHSWLLPVIAGFATLNAVSTSITLVVQYEEKPVVLLISKIFGIYNAIALIVLLPIAGVYGAAIASGSAQLMKNAYIWWNVRARARWTNGASALIAGMSLWAIVVFVCRWITSQMQFGPILSIAIGLLVIGVATLLHLRGPALSTADRTTLAAVFRGRESKWMQWAGLLRASDAGNDVSKPGG